MSDDESSKPYDKFEVDPSSPEFNAVIENIRSQDGAQFIDGIVKVSINIFTGCLV